MIVWYEINSEYISDIDCRIIAVVVNVIVEKKVV